MTWREYLSKHMKGKKFPSRKEANIYFKKLAMDYKKSKG